MNFELLDLSPGKHCLAQKLRFVLFILWMKEAYCPNYVLLISVEVLAAN